MGFKIQNGVLSINPCISKDWKEFEIQYRYGESIYNIKVTNPSSKETGVSKFIFNNEEIKEKQIKLEDNGKINEIKIIM